MRFLVLPLLLLGLACAGGPGSSTPLLESFEQVAGPTAEPSSTGGRRQMSASIDPALGAHTFQSNCTPCHGSPEKPGPIGPDLFDATWIHGGATEDIERVIREGVPAKGCPTWGAILSPQKTASVAAYIQESQRP